MNWKKVDAREICGAHSIMDSGPGAPPPRMISFYHCYDECKIPSDAKITITDEGFKCETKDLVCNMSDIERITTINDVPKEEFLRRMKDLRKKMKREEKCWRFIVEHIDSMDVFRKVRHVPPVEAKDGEDTCVICLVNKSTVALLPCGHLCCCPVCTPELKHKTCPICRGNLEDAIMIYQ